MRTIYHIVTSEADARRFQANRDDYRADSLATEGFIHLSNRDQAAWVAGQFYANQPCLWLLVIDAEKLTSPLRDEDPGCGQTFPHLYGPLNRDALIDVLAWQRGPDGTWSAPPAV